MPEDYRDPRLDSRTSAVEIRNVTKIFGQGDDATVAVEDVCLSVQENEFFTLLGPSGCGKTTLLRLIAGFEHPISGDILLRGKDISSLPPHRRSVNTVFQSYALFPHMTVAGNIGFGLEMLGKPKSEVAATVAEMLRLVRLEALQDRRISQISGGQQQRVALARALAPRPQVLLLDEPLSALDLELRKAMLIELKRLQQETRITFILVTHDQGEALAMSDRIAVMNAGRLLQIGTPYEIYDRPAGRFVARFIGESNFLEGTLETTHGEHAEVRLFSGSVICARLPDRAAMTPGHRVTLLIRPEHANLIRNSSTALLTAELHRIVYLGTDTHYHLTLAGGETFVVRMQNPRQQERSFREGEMVGIEWQQDAVQILQD